MGDLRAVLSVVHQKHFQLLGVVDQELVETVGQQVSGVLVGACQIVQRKRKALIPPHNSSKQNNIILTIADGRLGDGALESPSHSRVNTLLLSPRGARQALEALVVVALEGLGPLLHDLRLVYGSDLRHIENTMRDGGGLFLIVEPVGLLAGHEARCV